MNQSTKMVLFLITLATGLFLSMGANAQAQQPGSESKDKAENKAEQEQSLKEL